jgi:hypothetical protein
MFKKGSPVYNSHFIGILEKRAEDEPKAPETIQ